MARPCLVCTHPNRQAIETLMVNGASDDEIGRRFNVERVSSTAAPYKTGTGPARDRQQGQPGAPEREKLAAAAYSDALTPAEFVEKHRIRQHGRADINLKPAVGCELRVGFAALDNRGERLRPVRGAVAGRVGDPSGNVAVLR